MPSALHRPAATIAQRSPQRAVISEAGILLSNEPMLTSPTTSAAIGTEAPRSRAISTMTGSTAPSPMPNSSEGPKAATAMRRSENSAPLSATGSVGGGGELGVPMLG